MSDEGVLSVTVAAPAIGAALIALTGRAPNVRDGVTLVTSVALFLLVGSLAPAVLGGARPEVTWLELLPGAAIGLRVEPLGLAFGLVATGLWIANSVYSIGYMRGNKEHHQTRFYACVAVAIACTVGLAFAADLLTLLIFYEVLTISTYPLVTHHGTEEDMRAGRVYLGILVATSVCFLMLAIIWTWVATGTTEFREGGILRGEVDGPLVGVLLALFVYGTGKAAVMPVHRWLPAAMVAPTPVSALLHAVAVVKAGVFTVVKVVSYTFGLELLKETSAAQWLTFASGATIVLASVVALRQDNLKRRLAYSTISQLSYVVMAASLFTPAAIGAASVHIVTHAFGKITLFFAAGAIYTAAHKTKVSELNGIGKRMPWTMGAFAVGALSMIGLPPTGGFVSKWLIMSAAMEAERWFALAVLAISTVLAAAYLVPIVYRAFLTPEDEMGEHDAGHDAGYARGRGGHRSHGEAPWPMVAALVAPAGVAVAAFFGYGAIEALVRPLLELR